MDDARSLREQRDELAGKMNEILLRNDSIDDVESIELLENGEARLAELDTQIRGAEAREKVSNLVKKPSFGFTPGAATPAREDRRYRFEINGTEIKVVGGNPDVRVNPLGLGSDGSDATFTATDANGPVAGASIPVDLLAQMIRKLPKLAVLRQQLSVRTYSNDVELQRVNARISLEGDAFTAESGAYTEKIGSFERVRVRNFKSSARSNVTEEFLRDARGNAVQEMLLQHAEEHGLYFDNAYATGIGSDDGPEPVFLTPTAWAAAQADYADAAATPTAILDTQKTEISINTLDTGSAAAVAKMVTQALTTLRYEKIPAQYWGGLKWIMGQDTFAAIANLVDGQSRPLYQPFLTSTIAESNYIGTLLGLPVAVSNNLPTKGVGKVAAMLMHTEDYGIFDRVGFSQLVDPYTDSANGEVRYLTRMRSDGRWLRPYAAGQLVWAT
jgi:HK97 family phage major capsid protein